MMMRSLGVCVLLSFLSSLPSMAKAETAASFNCASAKTGIEKTICQSPSLRQLDAELSRLYTEYQQDEKESLQKTQAAAWQRNWPAQRDFDCTTDPTKYPRPILLSSQEECLTQAYNDQINYYKNSISYNNDPAFQYTKNRLAPQPQITIAKQPFTPKLLVSNDQELCHRFEQAVQKDYLSTLSSEGRGDLEVSRLSIEGATRLLDNKNRLFRVRIQNKPQTLAYASEILNWKTNALFLNAKSSAVSMKELKQIESGHYEDNETLKKQGWKAVDQETMGPHTEYTLYATKQGLYRLIDGDEIPQDATASKLPISALALYEIRLDGPKRLVCAVDASPSVRLGALQIVLNQTALAPTPTQLEAPKEMVDLFNSLSQVSGSSDGLYCSGGEGWSWHDNKMNYAFYASIARPWEAVAFSSVTATNLYQNNDPDKQGKHDLHAPNIYRSMNKDTALLYLNDWGLQNLYNFKLLRGLLAQIPVAEQSLAAFYQQEYGLPPDEAKAAAGASVNRIIAASVEIGLIYNWNDMQDNGLPLPAFTQKATAFLNQSVTLPPSYVYKAVLYGLQDLVSQIPSEQIAALNKEHSLVRGATRNEPILFYALENPAMAKLLIDKGADVNAVNWFGKTALMYAAQNNALDLIQTLISAQADVNAATKAPGIDGCGPEISARTALMYAAENASAEVIKLLISSGADKKAMDSYKRNISTYLALNEHLTNQERAEIQNLLQ